MRTVSSTIPKTALDRQRAETKRLQGEFDSVNSQFFAMSHHRNRIDIKNHSEFVQRHKDLFIKSVHLEADLKRSRLKEEALERAMARKQAELVAAGATAA